MFLVSSTTRPSRCAWLGSLAPMISTRRPISSCFRRFTPDPPRPRARASASFLLSRGNRLLGGRRDGAATEPLFLPPDCEDPRNVLPERSDLSGIGRGSAHRRDAALVHE